MKLSAPIYVLKRRARLLSRTDEIPYHAALDRIARGEGWQTWSLLVARASKPSARSLLPPALRAGDLVLVGARPGQGKTLHCLKISLETMKAGRACYFLSCEFNEDDLRRCFVALDEDAARFAEVFHFKHSDDLCSDFIMDALRAAPRQSVVVVDYLQALDHKRTRPELAEQIASLKDFAEESGLAMLFVSQIRRNFDACERPTPGLADVRLPNPLDLALFSKALFMHDGHMSFVTP